MAEPAELGSGFAEVREGDALGLSVAEGRASVVGEFEVVGSGFDEEESEVDGEGSSEVPDGDGERSLVMEGDGAADVSEDSAVSDGTGEGATEDVGDGDGLAEGVSVLEDVAWAPVEGSVVGSTEGEGSAVISEAEDDSSAEVGLLVSEVSLTTYGSSAHVNGQGCTRRGAQRQHHDLGIGSSHSRIVACNVSQCHYNVLTITTAGFLPHCQARSVSRLCHSWSSQDAQNG